MEWVSGKSPPQSPIDEQVKAVRASVNIQAAGSHPSAYGATESGRNTA